MHQSEDAQSGQETLSESSGSRKTCPECQAVLQQGFAVRTNSWLTGEAYLCPVCQVIYSHDLQPLARLVR